MLRCCLGSRGTEISQSPGTRGPRKKLESAGQAAIRARCRHRSRGPPGLDALDESGWKAQIAAQPLFATRHLAVVPLVVVATQVENAVQREDFDFQGRGVSERTGVAGSNFSGDGDVTCEMDNQAGR